MEITSRGPVQTKKMHGRCRFLKNGVDPACYLPTGPRLTPALRFMVQARRPLQRPAHAAPPGTRQKDPGLSLSLSERTTRQ